jgi:hypothetical protein
MDRIRLYTLLGGVAIFFKLYRMLIWDQRKIIASFQEMSFFCSQKILTPNFKSFDSSVFKNVFSVIINLAIDLERKFGNYDREIWRNLRKAIKENQKILKDVQQALEGLIFQLLMLNGYLFAIVWFLTSNIDQKMAFPVLPFVLNILIFLICILSVYFYQSHSFKGIFQVYQSLITMRLLPTSLVSFSEILKISKFQELGEKKVSKKGQEIVSLLQKKIEDWRKLGLWSVEELSILLGELEEEIFRKVRNLKKAYELIKMLCMIFCFIPSMFWIYFDLGTRIFDSISL